MSATKGRAESDDENGAMISPAYGLRPRPSRPGTIRPLEAEIRPKIPSIARRPARAYKWVSA